MFGLKDPATQDWTHTNFRITDIRKLSEFYIFTVAPISDLVTDLEGVSRSLGDPIDLPLMVKDKIFEERLRPYFLKDAFRVSRDEILSVNWNFYITKGYYIKIQYGEVYRYDMDPEKCYVSFLEIAGPLATFASILKDKEKDLH
jgi:hypothetical protein